MAKCLMRLDSDDLITEIHLSTRDDWLAKVRPDEVIGSNIFAHVMGLPAASFLRAVLDGARRGHRISVPYRCDAVDRRRSWIMEAKSTDEGLIVSHRLMEDAAFDSQWTFRTASDSFLNAVPRTSLRALNGATCEPDCRQF
jgi:hypothetical protein